MGCQHVRMDDIDKTSKQEKGNGDNDGSRKYISNIFRDIGEDIAALNNTLKSFRQKEKKP